MGRGIFSGCRRDFQPWVDADSPTVCNWLIGKAYQPRVCRANPLLVHEAVELGCDGPVETVPDDVRIGVSEATHGWLDAG